LNRLVTVPRLMTRLLDFLGLNFILAQVATSSNAFSTHLACIWVWVVTVRSSMKPLFVGRCNPVDVFGPRVYVSGISETSGINIISTMPSHVCCAFMCNLTSCKNHLHYYVD